MSTVTVPSSLKSSNVAQNSDIIWTIASTFDRDPSKPMIVGRKRESCKIFDKFQRRLVRNLRLELLLRFPLEGHMQHHVADKPPRLDVESTAPALLRLPLVIRVTGLGRSTIYKLISEKKFPGPVRVSERRVAWRRVDIDRWSEERPPAAH